ncbi:MAG TPA: hypothetical protein EYH35_04990 [Thiotrichaceae bacterium]|nr:hypothetical protein [Thiotrichaceae bacterium]
MSSQQRKVTKLAATFMVTTLGAAGCSTPEVASKDPCHVHESFNQTGVFEGRHCHKIEKSDHKHLVAMPNPPPPRPLPPISGNPAPPKPPK